MPNWCFNRVVFTGAEADCAAFRELMGAERGAFDFNAVVPMPPELERCNMADQTAYALKYGDWESEPWFGGKNYPSREGALQAARHPENADRWVFREYTGPGPKDFTNEPRTFDEAADMAHANMLAHGHVYWRGWRGEHWGTKWSVAAGDATWSSEPGRVVVEFDTAWAPPLPLLERLAERFHGAGIEATYTEPQMGFRGKASFAVGYLIENDHEWMDGKE